jgi:hypothetical protein
MFQGLGDQNRARRSHEVSLKRFSRWVALSVFSVELVKGIDLKFGLRLSHSLLSNL